MSAVLPPDNTPLSVTIRNRLADGYFVRFVAKEDDSTVTARIDEQSYGAQKFDPAALGLSPKFTWQFSVAWRGAVFDTQSGLLDSAGDFYAGDAQISAVYIPQDGTAVALKQADFTLAGSTLTLATTASPQEFAV